jgi:hypothetical protein
MTHKRPLPNHCLWAITDATMLASQSIREVRAALATPQETYKRLALILDQQHQIIETLQAIEKRKAPDESGGGDNHHDK